VNETFRPRSNFVWAGTSLTLLVLFVANSFFTIRNPVQVFFEIAIALLLGGVTYVIWIKPKLILREETIEVVNPLRTELIPYREILDLETKWALTIVHSGGRTRVWVAPASGKRRWIADTTFGWYGRGVPLSDSGAGGSESMSASLSSFSGQAAYMIRERIKRLH
jgi:hypothetical protein